MKLVDGNNSRNIIIQRRTKRFNATSTVTVVTNMSTQQRSTFFVVCVCILLQSSIQCHNNVAAAFVTSTKLQRQKSTVPSSPFLSSSRHEMMMQECDSDMTTKINNWMQNKNDNNRNKNDIHSCNSQRRRLLFQAPLIAASMMMMKEPAHALVKGNAPPPPKSVGETKAKCTNLDECQAQAELREQERIQSDLASASGDSASILTTPSGLTRYRDLVIGSTSGSSVQNGDTVSVYYKVLKLGKRSYDGISGEGTVIFSRGYGYEDDEPNERTKSYTTTVGNLNNINAFNDAILGMKLGGIRRFTILPDQGWRKPGKLCDGGPGGQGAGGELRTDYVVVPTATMVDAEKCFDNTKQPFPTTYAQQRRMAQRFDQSLIMEIEIVSIN